MLIDKGANIEVKCGVDNLQCTPIMWAARDGHTEVVQVLIEKGANINAIDKEGCTALDLALLNNHGDTIEFLTNNVAKFTQAGVQFKANNKSADEKKLLSAVMNKDKDKVLESLKNPDIDVNV